MSKRIVVPFRHADPDVQPSAQLFFGAPYLPGIAKALHAIQDADAALQGIPADFRANRRISEAMAAHREAVLPLARIVRAGGAA